MIKLSKSAGFSLVELMIVVAIMAILAAIAIPSFMRFSMRAKTAEATQNLGAIRTCEESYRAENDVYYLCAVTPVPGGNDSQPDAWAAGGIADFTQIGFAPDGNVRYSYQIVMGTGGAAAPGGGANDVIGAFSAIATGDIDEDAAAATFTLDSGVATYPKAIKAGDDY